MQAGLADMVDCFLGCTPLIRTWSELLHWLLECSDADIFSAPMAVLVEQIHADHSCEAHRCFSWNDKRFFFCPSLLVFLWRYCHHIRLGCQWEKSQSCVVPHPLQQCSCSSGWASWKLIYLSAKASIREVMEVCVGGTQGFLSWCCVPWCSFKVSM